MPKYKYLIKYIFFQNLKEGSILCVDLTRSFPLALDCHSAAACKGYHDLHASLSVVAAAFKVFHDFSRKPGNGRSVPFSLSF